MIDKLAAKKVVNFEIPPASSTNKFGLIVVQYA